MSTLGVTTIGDVTSRLTSMNDDVEALNAIQSSTGMLSAVDTIQWQTFYTDWRKQYVGFASMTAFTGQITGMPGVISDLLDPYAVKIAGWKTTMGETGPTTPVAPSPGAAALAGAAGALGASGSSLFSIDTSTKFLIGGAIAAVLVIAIKR
jgi:hypothetical protein